MAATLIHLVRHGEVHNPDRVLYGRIPGFHLSALGHQLAAVATAHLAGHPVTALFASPLQRTQESAAPWAAEFGLPIQTDDRLIEPTNRFEGQRAMAGSAIVTSPRVWPWLVDPFRPSWGEPYLRIAARMIDAIDHVFETTESGEAVIVSHQLPIVMVQRSLARTHLWHDPRARTCSLSSITTIRRITDAPARTPRYQQVAYVEPGAQLMDSVIDAGAV